ncbi:hypothetical protein J3R30DRAFT_3427254 [Lentinula aciculospora]|uniref:Uncharacterized protein n=1 Tax=Lentinula aciculospora TaxID=153920 RepID=A0A9W9AUK7_9AGAR|nr:hypothetical protein J3R30DRAFT_3427254 [Lentinula aciculospora]
MLPEEILHVIVKYIISNPVILESELFELHWKHSRTRLLPLSLVNHQFRRICMPFLFAYVEIRGAYGDLKKLRDWCASSKPFALSIRSIDYYCYSLEHIDILHHLLHFLTNLSQIILNDGGYLDVPLLNIISQHPVQSVVVASWKSLASSYLNQLGPCSLSKITLDSMKLLTESIEHNFVNRLQCGMQIRCLTVPPKMLVPAPNSFSNCKFTGLCELELWLSLTPEVSWLPTFIDNHPLLERIRFSITCVQWNVVPFILPFLETIVEEGLIDTVEIKAFSIARNSSTALPPSTDSLHGWHVASLWFCISKWSSGRLLDLAHSFFPQISMLSIEAPLPDTDCASMVRL